MAAARQGRQAERRGFLAPDEFKLLAGLSCCVSLLSGDAACAEPISAWKWLPGALNWLPASSLSSALFALLDVGRRFSGARKHSVRRLVSGWYYVASQLDYAPDEADDEGEQGETDAFDPTELMKALTEGMAEKLGALTACLTCA